MGWTVVFNVRNIYGLIEVSKVRNNKEMKERLYKQ